MRVAVVGAGGVGGYFGGKLAAAGIDTVFIARGATLAALRQRGLIVESIDGDFTVSSPQATDDPREAGKADAVLLSVKAWQLGEAAEQIRPMLGPDTAVVPLENGVEAPEQLAAALGPRHAVGGLCAIVSYAVAPGHIRHAASEPLVMFGELDGRRSARLEALREAFERAGVKAEVPPDIRKSMWSKFLFITTISGIGAVTRQPVGVWRAIPETRALAERMASEVAALARARGIALADDAVARTMDRYDALASESTASLQRDVADGKPSELEAQIGAVVRMSAAAGLDAPVHDFVYRALLPQERRARGEI